ncbi:hypothetical protein, partial [Clostridium sp. AM58-1XD]|uniref:hypothetical protein n=1 Tax=Clostridium sp. AM58-1XD TaxID=2292307 RepID=UPI000EEB86A7
FLTFLIAIFSVIAFIFKDNVITVLCIMFCCTNIYFYLRYNLHEYVLKSLTILLAVCTLFMLGLPWAKSYNQKFRDANHTLKIETIDEEFSSDPPVIKIKEIFIDGKKADVSNYATNNPMWVKGTDISYEATTKSAFIANLTIDESLKVVFATNSNAGTCLVYLDGNITGAYDLYSSEDSEYLVDLSDKIHPRPFSKMYYFTLVILLVIVYKIFSILLDKALKKKTSDYFAWFELTWPCALVWFVYYLGFYPALFSVDTFNQYEQATLKIFDDWHPVAHTLLIRYIGFISKNPAIIVLLQIIVSIYFLGKALQLLCENGLSKRIAFIISCGFALFPANGVMLVNIWKDIPYSIAILGISYEILFMCLDMELWLSRKRNIAITICTLITIALFRHNGFVPYIFTVICLVVLLRKKIKSAFKIVIISTVIIFVIKVGVYKVYDVHPKPEGVAYSFLAHNMGTVYVEGGNLDSDDLLFMEKIMPLDLWKNNYHAYSHNTYVSGYPYIQKLSEYKDGFLRNYLKIAVKNIPLVVKDIFQLTNMIWEFKTPEGSYIYIAEYTDDFTDKNQEMITGQKIFADYMSYRKTPLTNSLIKVIQSTSKRGPDIIFWRFAWMHLIGLFGVLLIISRKRYSLLGIYIPYATNILSLFVSMISQSYRYVYSTTMVFPIIVGITIMLLGTGEKNETNNTNTLLQ